ncbi:MAG: thiol oxidoreductase, partial [Campylobacterales bacterium]|nr:thiol oxidoreductase [Campylobacterales bacterium]
PPLWGIGKLKEPLGQEPEFLHDGRAKSLEEAVLWHGGEAKGVRDAFMNLSKKDRKKLLKYIGEL